MKLRARTVIPLALLAALVTLAVPMLRPDCSDVRGEGVLSLRADDIGRGHGRKFCYTDSAGRKIRFILARGSDGSLHSVFDACRQCYNYRKGLAIARGSIICRLCGNRYSIEHMSTGKASCVPVALPHNENGSTALIRTADLESGKSLF